MKTKQVLSHFMPGSVSTWLKIYGALFLIYVALSLSGFSMGVWPSYLGPAQNFKTLYGSSRDIRSDDFMALIPIALSQVNSSDPFTKVNSNVVLGQNQLLIVSAPALHWTTFFRPYLWGYFLGSSVGISWHWAFYWFSFLSGMTLLFSVVAGSKNHIAPLAAVSLLWAPFFQYWGLNSVFLVASGALATYCFLQLFQTTSALNRTLFGLAMGYGLGCFALTLYPPFQVSVMWVFIIGIASTLAPRFKSRSLLSDIQKSVVPIALGLGVLFSAVLALFWSSAHEIELVTHTVYPGARVSTGGGMSLVRVFLGNLFPLKHLSDLSLMGGNLCEAANFFYVAPVSWLTWAVHSRKRSHEAKQVLPMAAIWLFFFVWQTLGVPSWFAVMTGFSRVPDFRSRIGMGVADLFAVVQVLSFGSYVKHKKLFSKSDFVIPALYLCFVGSVQLDVFGTGIRFPFSFRSITEIVKFDLMAALAIALLWKNRTSGIWVFALLNLSTTFWFNPILFRGDQALLDSSFSHSVLKYDRDFRLAQGRGSRWVIYNDLVIGKVPPALGVQSFNALQFYPQMEFWNQLDPKGDFKDAYNRYAHVAFILPDTAGEKLNITSPQSDVVNIAADPDQALVMGLGYDFLAYRGSVPTRLMKMPALKFLESKDGIAIFRRVKR